MIGDIPQPNKCHDMNTSKYIEILEEWVVKIIRLLLGFVTCAPSIKLLFRRFDTIK